MPYLRQLTLLVLTLAQMTHRHKLTGSIYVSGKLPAYTLFKPNTNTYFSLWAKCYVWGGVGDKHTLIQLT